MRTINIRVAPSWHYAASRWGIPQISAEGLVDFLPEAAVQVVCAFGNGISDCTITVHSGTRDEDLDQIKSAVEAMGFQIVTAVVTEWATRCAEGAITGLVAGLGVSSKLKSDAAILVSLLAGPAIGAYIGAQIRYAESNLHATRTVGGWVYEGVQALPSS
jgi:hypothetical protein